MQAKKAQEDAASRLAVQVRQLLRLLPPAQTGPPASPSRLTEIHPLMPRVGRVRCLLLLLCWAGSPQNSLPWGSAMTV